MKNLGKGTIVGALLLFAVFAGTGYAFSPPPPPPVPQNLGIYDNSIDSFQTNATDQSACRFCHQTSGTNISGGYNNTVGGVPTRHHSLVATSTINPYTNAPFGCQDCHPSTPGTGNGILLDRSCTDCHNSTNFWADSSLGAHVGNFSRPHHVNTSYDDAKIGNPVAARQCNFCHGSFVNNYNDSHYKPTYATDFMITPFATWKATNFSQPLQAGLFNTMDQQVLDKTWGGCESCHLGNYNQTSSIGTPTSIGNNHFNHHREILGGNVTVNGVVLMNVGPTTPFDLTNAPGGRACFVCHVVASTGSPLRMTLTNPFTGETLVNAMEVRNSTIESTSAVEFISANGNITFNGTGCEKCHGVSSIHNIEAPGAGTTQGLGHIGNNTDCYGCHNSWLPADTNPMAGAIIPSLDNVVPAVLSAGTATTLTITGGNFVNDVTNPDGTVTHYTSVVTVDGVSYTPASIIDSQIVVNIPALATGIHQIQLVKGGDTLSKLSTLTVVPAVTLSSVTLNGGTLTISGAGLGDQPPTNAPLYVSVNHEGNQIVSSNISSWSDTQIQVQNSAAAAGDVVTVMTANGGQATATVVALWLKGDLNNNGVPADAGDLVLMKRASIGEIPADSRYDLNNNGVPADAGDLVLMKRASIGEINL